MKMDFVTWIGQTGVDRWLAESLFGQRRIPAANASALRLFPHRASKFQAARTPFCPFYPSAAY